MSAKSTRKQTNTDAECFDEQRFYNEKRAEVARVKARNTFPKLRPGLSAMVPNINRCNVFHPSGPKKGTLKVLDSTYLVSSYGSEDESKGSIRYVGAHLTQYHKRVLLGLLGRVGGKLGDTWVGFHAVEFLESIGKEGDSRTVNKLLDALTELRSATFCVRQYDTHRADVFGWVMKAEFSPGSRQVRVLVDGKGAQKLFELDYTYLPTSMRNRLHDGLATWLFDFIFSSEQSRFSYAPLAGILGRTPGSDFGKEVRAALMKMAAVGAIDPPTFSRGRFTALKRPFDLKEPVGTMPP